jgi:hypothetical protein
MVTREKPTGLSVALAATIILSVSVSHADPNRPCIDPWVQAVRNWAAHEGADGPHHDVVAQLPELEARERKSCTPLSASENFRLTQEKRAALQAHLQATATRKLEHQAWTPSPDELGIHSNVEMPTPKGHFDYWLGYVNGALYEIFAGYYYDDPNQGVVIIAYGGNPNEYKTPTATGPIAISSVIDGVMNLHSVSGKHRAYNSRNDYYTTAIAPGGSVYRFDIRRQVFQQ